MRALVTSPQKGVLMLAFCVVLSTGCATHSQSRSYAFEEQNYSRAHSPSPSSRKAQSDAHIFSSGQVGQKLSQEYKRWKGTPYQYGGASPRGIDCSALMQQVFANQFQKKLPRTTIEQVKKGQKISFSALKPGDLIFFKTGYRRRHVGVYIGDNQFFHASSSRGVTVSHLGSSYWSKRKWQARRVL